MDELIIKRFQQISSEDYRNEGKIEDANALADGKGCRGSKDHLFLYLKIENGKIVDIKYKCAYCDPAMFVTAEILCDLVKGLKIDEISKIDGKDFTNLLGGESKEGSDHFEMAMKILKEGIQSYREKKGG
jgi:NifU-like protein involved in Fe-S cluster formation